MKLVEILACELKEWPEDVAFIAQDSDKWVGSYATKPVFDGVNWKGGDYIGQACGGDLKTRLYSDHATAIVTRADWEAERARIAKPAKKPNKDGWIRLRGGKCPVDDMEVVEVRFRDGLIQVFTAFGFSWGESGNSQIMAYRLHKPAEQPASDSEASGSVTKEMIFGSASEADSPLQWRDRITEIDASVEALEEERASLVQRLEAEGFRLIERVNAGIADAIKANESSWPEDAPSRDSAPDWATHIGRDNCGYHWFDHKPEKYDSNVFVKGLLGLNGYREGRHKKAKDMENNLQLWSCKI